MIHIVRVLKNPALFAFSVFHLLTTNVVATESAVSVVQEYSKSSITGYRPITVLSLNVAHGRGDSFNQVFLDKSAITSNLVNIAQVLRQADADVIALQELDAPSRWSKNFDHANWIAVEASYPEVVHSIQASSPIFNFGTALLSKSPFNDIVHYTFDPSPPTLNKGFTLGQIDWEPLEPSGSPKKIDIVSVHLDFSRQSVRERQIAELGKVLGDREFPIIILGDFNSDWFKQESVVRKLVENFKLKTYRPDALDLATYNSQNRRLDWVLISDDLAFSEYRVLPDVVSDHFAVYASIVVK